MATGTSHIEQQAQAGLKLFEKEGAGPTEVDVAAAEKYKAEIDEQIAALDSQIALLTGKDNKKERSAKSKDASELKASPQYVDACKVVKGLEPKSGFFVTSAPAKQASPDALAPPAEPPASLAKGAEKDQEKKGKKQESAGLSPAEKKELEQLKKDIVERKAQLKGEGLSGGQQNKDPQIVDWVKRMTELKEKEDPGSTQQADKKKDSKKKSSAPLSSEEQKELDALRGDIDTYRHRLKTEFGYSAKDMKGDEDLQDMEKRLAALEKRQAELAPPYYLGSLAVAASACSLPAPPSSASSCQSGGMASPAAQPTPVRCRHRRAFKRVRLLKIQKGPVAQAFRQPQLRWRGLASS
eukprot:CAMPEP_0171198168 /NCGR_PEP_ID=MMETSP0790-20130122/22790_1 /TAXON_ID=2925 /ORGANISM="Alexandrium catenella, Strain OF101" /LENGTH=352 /DNA_ID=CAMNT_0011663437 /DNA_START=58 /DNA_END=1115 /DNA_ORIENTATION=+